MGAAQLSVEMKLEHEKEYVKKLEKEKSKITSFGKSIEDKVNKDNIKEENKIEKEPIGKNEIILEQNKEEPKEKVYEIKPTVEQIVKEENEKIDIIQVQNPEPEIEDQDIKKEKEEIVIQISEP